MHRDLHQIGVQRVATQFLNSRWGYLKNSFQEANKQTKHIYEQKTFQKKSSRADHGLLS